MFRPYLHALGMLAFGVVALFVVDIAYQSRVLRPLPRAAANTASAIGTSGMQGDRKEDERLAATKDGLQRDLLMAADALEQGTDREDAVAALDGALRLSQALQAATNGTAVSLREGLDRARGALQNGDPQVAARLAREVAQRVSALEAQGELRAPAKPSDYRGGLLLDASGRVLGTVVSANQSSLEFAPGSLRAFGVFPARGKTTQSVPYASLLFGPDPAIGAAMVVHASGVGSTPRV